MGLDMTLSQNNATNLKRNVFRRSDGSGTGIYFGPNVLKYELIPSWKYLHSIDFSLIGHNSWKVIIIHHCPVLGMGLQSSTRSYQMNFPYSQLVFASFSEEYALLNIW